MSKPIALVTGSNGFIGSALIRALDNAGWSVRRAVRVATGQAGEVVVGSIGRATVWEDSVKGADAVIHLAARVHDNAGNKLEESYREVNTAGTLSLAAAAANLGVRDFIFVSTVLVHGRANMGAPLREADPPLPDTAYAASKLAAEQGLRGLGSSMRITVVRPPLVYGQGARGNFALLQKAVLAGIPLPLADIDNRRAFVSRDNLVSFVLHRLCNSGAAFDTFFVADDEQVSTSEFVKRLARAAGKSERMFSLPPSVLRLLLKASGRGGTIGSLTGSLELDIAKVYQAGWRPVETLDEGLRRSFLTCAPDAPTSPLRTMRRVA
ncbi:MULTISPECIES: NAD-dependent epimerase/dehydratase family protein [unclassified Bradyrhizobium]|uniref:NAD-dependent epimerase/dehydratase family protein n=1 Tax=unclassified Bradyrhizobium TaxID=2631580 RepID=UPI0028ED145A|nr:MULTISPECIES: NAD-dependent epimerase/dehydratase family protein [unclassified Bradyrhizobium]